MSMAKTANKNVNTQNFDFVVGEEPRETKTYLVKLVGEVYTMYELKTSTYLEFTRKIDIDRAEKLSKKAGKSGNPAKKGQVSGKEALTYVDAIMDWTASAFPEDIERIRERMNDSKDSLDLEDLIELFTLVQEKQTENPTT